MVKSKYGTAPASTQETTTTVNNATSCSTTPTYDHTEPTRKTEARRPSKRPLFEPTAGIAETIAIPEP